MSCNHSAKSLPDFVKSDIKLVTLARAKGKAPFGERAYALLEGILRKLCKELETVEKEEHHHIC
jgi:hypothetical protein